MSQQTPKLIVSTPEGVRSSDFGLIPANTVARAAAAATIHPHALLLAHDGLRRADGIPDMTPVGTLMYAAQDQADWMARFARMEHTRPSGYDLSSRLEDYGVAFGWAGENIAAGFADLESLMAAWSGSPGHRANILSRDATHCGFGIAGSWFCVVFARMR